MLYFAYGSNLDWDQMRDRCPSARYLGNARLADHQLVISRKSIGRGCGVADVIPSVGESVWGVIYEISDADAASLDRDEGYRAGRKANAYDRIAKEVVAIQDGTQRTIRVQTYVASAQPNPPAPSRKYLDQIITGARHWQLPEEYIERLKGIRVA
jgi:gamma-glutamylcyclotransferase (GGCT)/AIG2-like uncharacterized protein YtfP